MLYNHGMSKIQTFRQKLVQFLIKHDVMFNVLAFLLAVVAIPISLAVFPNATIATFVIAALTGVSASAGALSASLMTADERKNTEEEDEEDDQQREDAVQRLEKTVQRLEDAVNNKLV